MSASINNLLNELRALGNQIADLPSDYPLERATFHAPASKADLDVLATLGRLPADYVEFLQACSGFIGMDFHNGYDFFRPSLVAGLAHSDGPPNFVRMQSTTSRAIPVAGDGGGNLFLLHLASPHRVWKWNHERGRTGPTVDETDRALSPIADGFTAFLERVVLDWKQVIAGNTNWKYISG